jgi:hypothetical protein
MVHKLFPNVYVGTCNDINDECTLLMNKISRQLCISNVLNKADCYNISFGKKDSSLYEALEICSRYIQAAISINENILICCDDGVTETVPILVNYLIRFLNMNFDSAQNFVLDRLPNYSEIGKRRYLNRLRYKLVKEPAFI